MTETDGASDAMELLRRRLAAGEITAEEFDHIKERLVAQPVAPAAPVPRPQGKIAEDVADKGEEASLAIQKVKRSLTVPFKTNLAWITIVAALVLFGSTAGSWVNIIAVMVLIGCIAGFLHAWYDIVRDRADRIPLVIGEDFLQWNGRTILPRDIGDISLSREKRWHAGFEGVDTLEVRTSQEAVSIPLHAYFNEPRHRSAVVQHLHDMRKGRASLRQLRRDLELFDFMAKP